MQCLRDGRVDARDGDSSLGSHLDCRRPPRAPPAATDRLPPTTRPMQQQHAVLPQGPGPRGRPAHGPTGRGRARRRPRGRRTRWMALPRFPSVQRVQGGQPHGRARGTHGARCSCICCSGARVTASAHPPGVQAQLVAQAPAGHSQRNAPPRLRRLPLAVGSAVCVGHRPGHAAPGADHLCAQRRRRLRHRRHRWCARTALGSRLEQPAEAAAAALLPCLPTDCPSSALPNGPYLPISPAADGINYEPTGDQIAAALKYCMVEGLLPAAELQDGQELTSLLGPKLTVSGL